MTSPPWQAVPAAGSATNWLLLIVLTAIAGYLARALVVTAVRFWLTLRDTAGAAVAATAPAPEPGPDPSPVLTPAPSLPARPGTSPAPARHMSPATTLPIQPPSRSHCPPPVRTPSETPTRTWALPTAPPRQDPS